MSAFILFPALPVPTKRTRCRSIPSMQQQAAQYEQFSQRDDTSRQADFARLLAAPRRARYHHIFLNSSTSPFHTAADLFFHSNPSPTRQWLVQQIPDDTFGTLRGAIRPTRAMLIEDVATDVTETSASRWIAALDRAGNVLSPMESHFVDYVLQAAFGDESSIRDGELFASEILNADWSSPLATQVMREKLAAHAEKVTAGPNCRLFEVLQSVDEPTCFKTVEIYRSLHDLEQHMKLVDPVFEKDIMECRAAVNRVRQLYRPLNA